MDYIAPRVDRGIGVAMARVASRFYFISIILVASTIYLPHRGMFDTYGLVLLAVLAAGMIWVFVVFPWDKYNLRVFILSYLFSSSILISLLVYFTGGTQSSYSALFFLIIFISYLSSQIEMFAIATVVSLFYLLPYSYAAADPFHLASAAITVLFFYLGTYLLYGITRVVLKKNEVLEELNTQYMQLYTLTAGLMKDLEKDAFTASLSESLKEHLPSTYGIVLMLDKDRNLVTMINCSIRTLAREPLIGTTYAEGQLASVRTVLETGKTVEYQLKFDTIDNDLRKMLSKNTFSVLMVPFRIADDPIGVMIFGEERQCVRAPFSNDKIQLASAITNQIAMGFAICSCYHQLSEARRDLKMSHDKIIKSERLATLGEVSRAVEHEINNPLSVIVNWSEIYREDATIDPVLRNKFQIIFDMSMRIMEVIRKLSDMKTAKSVEFMSGHKMTEID